MKLKTIDAPRSADITVYDDTGCWWIEFKWERTSVRRRMGKDLSVSAINRAIAEVFPENANDGLCRQ